MQEHSVIELFFMFAGFDVLAFFMALLGSFWKRKWVKMMFVGSSGISTVLKSRLLCWTFSVLAMLPFSADFRGFKCRKEYALC